MTTEQGPNRLSRRAFLTGVGLSAGAAALVTGGQTVGLLEPVNLFAPRVRDVGPQGVPVNRTSEQAKVTTVAADPAWALQVINGADRRSLSRADLLALPQVEHELPIACVEGWSQTARWSGVTVATVLAAAGAAPQSRLRFTSLEPEGTYRVMEMGPEYAADPRTLVALALGGEPLDIEHGYPARVIAPGRPGVLQTKWLASVEVIS